MIPTQVARKAIDRLKNDTIALQQRIMARKAGANPEALPDFSDSFLKLTASEETCKEVLEMYQKLWQILVSILFGGVDFNPLLFKNLFI